MQTNKENDGHHIKLIMNDLKRGMKGNIVKYFIYIVFLVVSLSIFDRMAGNLIANGEMIDTPGVYDRLIYLFAGNKPYNIELNNNFSFQPIWLVMVTMPAFIVYSYASTDIEGIGLQLLLRVQNKRTWWLSKCIWNVVSVLLLHIIMYISVILISIASHCNSVKDFFTIHSDVISKMCEITVENNKQTIIMILVVPLIISISVSLIQMTLSFMINPAISFLIVIVMNVLASFFNTKVLLNEYTMIIRWGNGIGKIGSPLIGILIGVACAVLAIIIGQIHFMKMDIIERNK